MRFSPQNFKEELSNEYLNAILASIKLMPTQIRGLSNGLYFSKAKFVGLNELAKFKVTDLNGKGVEDQIIIYERSETLSYLRKVGLMVHELSHFIGHRLGRIDKSPLWQNVGCGWERYISIYSVNCPEEYVSQYSMNNPWEDWAESLTAYIFIPEKFESEIKNKSAFIGGLFKGEVKYDLRDFKRMFTWKERRSLKKSSIYKKCMKRKPNSSKLRNSCFLKSSLSSEDTLKRIREKWGYDIYPFLVRNLAH